MEAIFEFALNLGQTLCTTLPGQIVLGLVVVTLIGKVVRS